MKILIVGISGKMGRTLFHALNDDVEQHEIRGVDIVENDIKTVTYHDFTEVDFNPDVIVDFSSRSALDDVLDFSEKHKTSCVFLATDYTENDVEKIKELSKKVAVLKTANTSVGITLLLSLVKSVKKVFKTAGITITETHHIYKKDAPSGTALAINDAVDGSAEIISIRQGEVVGTHEIKFDNGLESITITHEANDRKLFADGALLAAEFVYKKDTGFYTMQDVVESLKKSEY